MPAKCDRSAGFLLLNMIFFVKCTRVKPLLVKGARTMRQRGRIGRLQRETMPYEPHLNRPAPVHHLLPAPDDLEESEKQLWRAIVAQHNFNTAAAALLHSGLRSRAIARTAHQASVSRKNYHPERKPPRHVDLGTDRLASGSAINTILRDERPSTAGADAESESG